MASSDAVPVPRKNVAFRVTFPILDADGDLVTGATSPDSEVSKDGGTFADCTNEATEIATASGMYYLDLTSTEMNADTVAVIVKSGNGKTTSIVLYPEEAGDIRADAVMLSGDATAADNLEAAFDDTDGPVPRFGIVDQGTAQSASSTGVVLRAAAAFADDVLIGNVIGVFGSTQGYWQFAVIDDNALSGDSVTISPAFVVTPSGTITYKIFGSPRASTTNLPVVDLGKVSGDATAADTLELFAEALDQATGQLDSGSLAAGTVTAGAVATGAIDADAIAADAVAEIQAGLATAAALATIDDFLDTEIAAILAAVDTEVAAIKTVTDQFTAAQAEPTAVPAANATPLAKLAFLAALARNRITQTATAQVLFADDGTTPVASSTISDNGTTFVRGEFA